ncbi:MAG: hypothetical protein NXY57DRAFT_904006, partial [Lentinula lateritia]
SYHWAFEHLVSAALVPMTVAAFATSRTNYPIFDGILGLSLIIHSYIGVRRKMDSTSGDCWDYGWGVSMILVRFVCNFVLNARTHVVTGLTETFQIISRHELLK